MSISELLKYKKILGASSTTTTTAAGPDVMADVTASFNVGTTHANQFIPANSTSAIVATIVPDATTNHAIGTTISLERKGTGGVSFAAGAGVTLNTPQSLSANKRFSVILAKKTAANEWLIMGDML